MKAVKAIMYGNKHLQILTYSSELAKLLCNFFNINAEIK